LRPRWYWHWFEEECVQLEHQYVMTSMKNKAEQDADDQVAAAVKQKF
jgi:activator of HSP90 ATPase